MAIMQHKPNRVEDAVEKLSPIVYKLAHKYARNHKSNDLDDIIQLGFEGLMVAYNNFDPTKGRAFSSHAYQWIWAVIKCQTEKTWKVYNQTYYKPIEDVDAGSYSMPLDDLIDAKTTIDNMDPTARAIHVARQQGFTYREIAEAMETLGTNMTLHQVRNHHLRALAS